MSSFTTPFEGRLLDREMGGRPLWELLRPFEYHVGHLGSGDIITVPAGATTDFASVPRPLWIILPPTGRAAKAAVIHDQLYVDHSRPRAEADRIFLEGMEVLGVSKPVRVLAFWAVRLFGRRGWRRGINRS